jgi:hypothetical protein
MTQAYDPRGLRLASSNAEAVAACNAGVEGYNRWRADAIGHLDAAMQADPDFALPKITKAWILHMGRSASFAGKVEELTAQAEACLDPAIERDSTLLAALRVASAGRGIEAATILEAHLDRHPTDLLAHRLVQFELFWNGRAAWMLDIVERAAQHWSPDVEGYGAYLSCRAFSNEEYGNYADAERHGREAVFIDPADVWGAHAVAHVLVMQGRVPEGAYWLEELSGNWGEANQLRHHLWWHLCLFLLERGEHERILELLTSQIRNPDSALVKAVPDATIDLQNVASLLLRLELRGVDVSGQWDAIADICAGRIHDHANAFTNAHDMMVLAATERFAEAEELLRSVRACVAEGHGNGNLVGSYRSAGIAVCDAVLAHRKGEHQRVLDVLSPVRHDLHLIGGSHAQRDVFYQLLLDSAHRLGRADLVSLYLNDVRRIGFENVQQRTLYADMASAA